MKPFRFHGLATQEIRAATAWYAKQREQLPREFQQEIQSTLFKIQRNREFFPVDFEDVRSALMDRFPFCIYFTMFEEFIWVLAVSHTSREPYYWADRLPET